MTTPPGITAIVPLWNEEESLLALHTALAGALSGLSRPYEILYVNDGSTDRSRVILAELFA